MAHYFRKIEIKSKSGAIPDMKSVIWDTPIGQAIKRMCNENVNTQFFSVQYII